MKLFSLFFLFINFILIIVLITTQQNYQKTDLWKYTEEYNPIQKTEFLPIKSIKVLAYPAKDISDFDFIKTDGVFSIVKNEEYSKECLKNYFVKETSECPITDIIVKTSSISPEGYTNQKIANNIYLHYTNEKKLEGTLYEGISVGKNYLCYSKNEFKIDNKCLFFESNFNYKNVSSIVDLEKEKKSNPFKNLKNYAKYCDKIYLSLVIIAFFYTIFEPYGNRVFNYYKIINLAFHIFILILLSIRYDKYLKIKKYLKENKDIYESIMPKLAFNFDTVFISFSISFLMYYILYLITPSACHCIKLCCKSFNQNNSNSNSDSDSENKKYSDYLSDRKNRIIALIMPIYMGFICIIAYEIVNEILIRRNYEIINYNSKLNSISSISINNNDDSYTRKFYWRKDKIGYKTNEYNYYDIYSNNNDNLKICGKDIMDNDLYFPRDVECPINDIVITKSDYSSVYNDYTKIQLSDGYYLYYTNKNTKGKIVTAIICNGDKYYDNDENEKKILKILDKLNSSFFYDEIDTWNIYKLYAVYYLGVNKNLIDKINDFKENFGKLNILSIIKYVSLFFGVLFITFSGILISTNLSFRSFVLGIVYQILMIFYIIINFICLKYNKKYIQNFLNQINFYFERNKCDSIWTFLLIVLGVIFFLYYIFIFIFIILSSERNLLNINNIISNPSENNQPRNSIASIPNENNQPRNSVGVNPNENNHPRNSVGSNPSGDIPLILRYVPIGGQGQRQEQGQESKESLNELEQKKKEEEEKIINEVNKKKEEEKEHNCVICMTNEAKIILCPCGHKCVCEACYNDLNSRYPKRCPICRNEFIGKIDRVFSV
jgi:hypothetical protein